MTTAWRYGPPERDRQYTRYAEIMGTSFNASAEEVEVKIRAAGSRMIRLVHDDRRVAGGALLCPMGQWFQGRIVPMTAIGAVAVHPAQRSRGLAARLMRWALEEIHEKGVALSSLYPALASLYEQAGYEIAGARYEIRLLPRTFDVRDRALEIRELDERELPKVHALYAERVRDANGPLDRSAPEWQRFFAAFRGPLTRYGLWNGERLEGCISYAPRLREGALMIREMLAASPSAVNRLLAFLGAHRTQVEACVYHGPPADPILGPLEPFSYQVRVKSPWMLRIVDVARALEARGYAARARGAVTLAVRDDFLAHNRGRFRLEVEEGRAAVRKLRGGRAGGRAVGQGTAREDVRIDVRGLAALYSGFSSARDLAALTPLAEGSARALETLDAIFAGPTPWMADEF